MVGIPLSLERAALIPLSPLALGLNAIAVGRVKRAQDMWLIFKLRYGQTYTWAMASCAYRLQLFWFLASGTLVVIDMNIVMGMKS